MAMQQTHTVQVDHRLSLHALHAIMLPWRGCALIADVNEDIRRNQKDACVSSTFAFKGTESCSPTKESLFSTVYLCITKQPICR
jgi:hypothetical protein